MKKQEWILTTLDEFKKRLFRVEFPQKITNEWLDELEKNEDLYESYLRWGFCYRDMSGYDLSELDQDHLKLLSFNSSTIWPSKDKMPKGFDPNAIIEKGKDPMLGVRDLHQQGIDGSGVTIAVIDQGVKEITHEEFDGANIELTNLFEKSYQNFHGEAVLANLCGKTIGIASKARVLFYNTSGDYDTYTLDTIVCLKDILRRVNAGEKIQAVNISGPLYQYEDEESVAGRRNIKRIEKLVKILEHKNCKVITSEDFADEFRYLDLPYNCKADDINNFGIPYWWDWEEDSKFINIVCGGKSIPEYLSNTGYKLQGRGSASWSIPQAVGLYALCLQVNPNATWEQFVEIAKTTAVVNAKNLKIANPKEIVKAFAYQNGKDESHT